MRKTTLKMIRIYALLLVLLLAAGCVLIQVQYGVFKEKDLYEGQLKLGSVVEVLRSLEDRRQSSKDSFENHLDKNVEFMTAVLRDDVTEEGYTGERLFEDGAVVELRGDSVLWPDGVPEAFRALTADEIRDEGRVEKEFTEAFGEGDSQTFSILFTTGRISGDDYYVNWTPASELLTSQNAYLTTESFLERAEEIFAGSLLFVDLDDSSLKLLNRSREWPEAESASELGFTAEIISEKQQVVEIGGTRYLCSYATSEDGTITLIYVRPLKALVLRAFNHTAMILISMLIILSISVYFIFAVHKYVREHKLSKNLSKRYKPDSFRRILVLGAVTGAIIIFFTSFVFLSIGSLHNESIVSADNMGRLFDYLQEVSRNRTEYDTRQAEEWDLYQCRKIAGILSKDPSKGSREKLREYCSIFGFDYMMVFDSQGREVSTNSGMTGMTLDDLGEYASDYKRLLKGVSSVVHETGEGLSGNLSRVVIGLPVPNENGKDSDTQGALIIAAMPQIRKDGAEQADEDIYLFRAEDRTCLNADPETGEILHCSSMELAGKTIEQIGLPEKSLEDGFSDFAMVNGISSYVTSRQQDRSVFMYIISKASVFRGTLTASLCTVAAYLLIAWIVMGLSNRGYNRETFEKWTSEAEGPDEDRDQDRDDRDEGRHTPNFSTLLVGISKCKWKDMTPDTQAGILLKISNILLVAVPSLFLLQGGRMGAGASSLLHYVLYGDWMRGINLFSLCGMVIVSTAGALFLLTANILLSVIAGVLRQSGETVCRILYNVIRYIVFLVVIYYVFEYAGISMSTYIASVSLISIALSLGSKDMVSDMLSGVLILFEHQFKVGDIVEIDKVKGKVMEIGVRSTQLLCDGNDIRFISNSTIRNVVNKSLRISACMVELSLVTLNPLKELEELFNRELPEIGKKDSRIVNGPNLSGITKMTGGGKADSNKTITVRVSYECRERDSYAMKDFVNRELFLLCERENLQISNQLASQIRSIV